MPLWCGHTILLGGIGGDAHSVGLAILRQALRANGYRVRFMGTQNRLEELFQLAPFANVVMLSSLDGHARRYLREFPELLKRYPAAGTRWYVGGNLHIDSGEGCERHFREMGFDRVFAKFVDLATVLSTLQRDLAGVPPVAEAVLIGGPAPGPPVRTAGPLADGCLEPDAFGTARREVLGHWRTGRDARDLALNAEFLGRQPSFPRAQQAVHAGKASILVQPRSGVLRVDDQIRLFSAFAGAGADVVSYQVDSLTRNNDYQAVDEAIRESRAGQHPGINGFPVVNHGVRGLRRVAAEVRVPIQTRHSTRDPRLLAEISYAGGVTAFEGGAICYNIPYYRDYALDESIRSWQYVDYLTGCYYRRFGIVLDREFFGTLTATLIPPALAITTNILEAILAVQQGVRCVSLGYAETGHRIQDVAAVRTLGALAHEFLANLGHTGVQVNTVFHQYMAAFPDGVERAEELILNSAVTARLSGATRVLVKTPVEAVRIPTLQDNLRALGLAAQGVAAAGAEPVDETRVAEEAAWIRREVNALMESVILCGRGSVGAGIVEGFRQGYLDVPFSPSIHNQGLAATARDTEGAVRFLALGKLQFDRELRDFHREKMDERRRAEGLRSARQDYLLVERDVMRLPRGEYARWPLFGGSLAAPAG